MKNIKIALVEYFNTLPFYDALLKDDQVSSKNLFNRNPGECAEMFYSGQAELALIPVVPYLLNGRARIVTDYCIGTEGEVRTVCLMSNTPIEDIKHVYLDSHSRTSAQLFHLLSKAYWNIDPSYSTSKVADQELKDEEAVLMIGDKVFTRENDFQFKYDLGKEWLDWTGLPFVFAVWVMKEDLPIEIETHLNSLFSQSFLNLPTLLKEHEDENRNFNLESYYKKNISFDFDEDKKRGLKHFEALCYKHFSDFSSNVLTYK